MVNYGAQAMGNTPERFPDFFDKGAPLAANMEGGRGEHERKFRPKNWPQSSPPGAETGPRSCPRGVAFTMQNIGPIR